MTATLREQVAAAYLAGSTTREVAAQHGLDPGTVRRWLHADGVPLRQRGQRAYPPDVLERIITLRRRSRLTWEQIAALVKLSPDYVKRLVGLLKLADPVKELLREGKISARVAIALKPLPPKQQIEMAQRALSEGLGAEEIRQAAQQLRLGIRRRKIEPPELDNVVTLTAEDDTRGSDRSHRGGGSARDQSLPDDATTSSTLDQRF